MIGYMRHGAPPRLMAPQSVRSADLRESNPTPPPGNRMTLAKGHHESELSILRGWHRGSGRVARHRTGALAHMRLSHYGFDTVGEWVGRKVESGVGAVISGGFAMSLQPQQPLPRV